MQVGIDVTCMYTNFGGCGLSNLGDIAILNKIDETKKIQLKYKFGPYLFNQLIYL